MARLHNHKTVVLASLLQLGFGPKWTVALDTDDFSSGVYVTLLHRHAAERLNFWSTEFVLL